MFMKYKIATGAVSMGLLLACGPVDVGLGGGSGGEAARDGVGGSYSGDTGGRNSTGGTDYDGLPEQFCGDGVIQYPEECDEPPGRETTCAPDCRLRVDSGGVGGSSTGGTAGRGGSEQFCGDGVVQYPEECDEPPGRETTCAPDCRLRSDAGTGGSGGGASEGICGDGVLDRGENCDDGNRADRDGCSSDCQYLDGGTGGTGTGVGGASGSAGTDDVR
jgi:cysteine-rich repeat protein